MDIIEVHYEMFTFRFQFEKVFFEQFKASYFSIDLLMQSTRKQLVVNVYTTGDRSLSEETYGNGFCGYIVPIQLQAEPKMDEDLRCRLQKFWGIEKNKNIACKKVEAMLRALEEPTYTSVMLNRNNWLSDFNLVDVCNGKQTNIFSPSIIVDMRVTNQKYKENSQAPLRLRFFDKLNGNGCTWQSMASILDYKNCRNIALVDDHFQFLPPKYSLPKKNDLVLALKNKIRLEALLSNYGNLEVSADEAPIGLPNKEKFCCINTAVNMIAQICYETEREFRINVANAFSDCDVYTVTHHADAMELICYLFEKYNIINEKKLKYMHSFEYIDYVSNNTKFNEEVEVLGICYPSLLANEPKNCDLVHLNDFGLVGFCIFSPTENENSKVSKEGVRSGHYVGYRRYRDSWYSLNDFKVAKITIERVVQTFIENKIRITFGVYKKDSKNAQMLLKCQESIEKPEENRTNNKRVRDCSDIKQKTFKNYI